MQLNGITLIGYDHSRDTLTAVLDSDYESILPLDGEELRVTEEDTDLAVFGGYHLTAMELMDNGFIQATFVIKLEPNTEQALNSINKNIEITQNDIKQVQAKTSTVQSEVRAAQSSANNAQSSANQANNGVTTLTDDIDIYGGAIEELGSTAADNAIAIEDLTATEEANSAAIEEIALQLFSEPE